MTVHTGRHFLQIPGPTNVPDRVLNAIHRPMVDHRGPEFAKFTKGLFEDIKTIFKTSGPVLIFPSSGTGAWESALTNTLSPGDTVLMGETGQFATLWEDMATKLGLKTQFLDSDWRHGVDPARVEEVLTADRAHSVKAVCVVHNETSTGITSDIKAIRDAIDAANHPALMMVDTISSLGSIDYRHEEWKIDVTIGGSQKGLMLPPGLGFVAISDKALEATKTARLPRCYFRWQDMLNTNPDGFFPYTPATNMLYGLKEAITMLHEEGLDNVFARHARHGEATRRAVDAWGLENLALNPHEYSDTVTAILMDGHDADAFRNLVLDKFDMALGTGLNKVAGKVFRIGHLGHFNDLMLAGTLSGVEMGLRMFGLDNARGGVEAAMDYLAERAGK